MVNKQNIKYHLGAAKLDPSLFYIECIEHNKIYHLHIVNNEITRPVLYGNLDKLYDCEDIKSVYNYPICLRITNKER